MCTPQRRDSLCLGGGDVCVCEGWGQFYVGACSTSAD